MATLDSAVLNTLIAAISALILASIAWMNKARTDSAAATAAATTQIATATTAPIAQPAPVTVVINTVKPYEGVDTRARDAHGNLTTNQGNGNQFWMAAGYKGPEPNEDTKRAFNDAQAAYENAVKSANDLIAIHGKDRVNPAILAISTE